MFSAPSGRAPRGARSRAVAPCTALGAARRAGSSRRPAPRRAANATRAAPKMVFERFTERAIKAVMEGQSEAKTMGRPEVLPEHLLLGVIAEDARFNQGQGPAAGGFYGAAQITLESSREAALVVLGGVTSKKSPKPQASGGGEVPFSLTSKRVFEAALGEAERLGHNFISPEHLVLALAAGPAQGTLDVLGAAGAELREAAERRLEQQSVGEGAAQGAQKGAAGRARRAPGAPGGQEGKSGDNALEDFCRDITQEAEDNLIDPVIGRDKEVSRVVEILARRMKNNPILLGEPGVGKTAIAEGLAQCIVRGSVPSGQPLPGFLKGKRVLSLDVGLLMAGAKERGELESRVTNLIAEVQAAGDVILMIDEVHTLVGAGSVARGGGGGGGGLDISNLLKPALARGTLQCIGATTVSEHRRIESDPALERRFQPVMVEEPSEEECLEILKGLRESYERHHRCTFTDQALEKAVALSSRYIADRYLPDKAVDLMDESGSRARISQHMARKAALSEAAGVDGGAAATEEEQQEGETLWEQLEQVVRAKDSCVRGETFEEASLLRAREMELKATLTGDNEDPSRVISTVGEDDIERIVAQWTGIPVEKLSGEDAERVLHLDDILGDRVIGQSEACKALARSMKRAFCGLKSPDRPIAAMMFCGPTGVGKTELTKALAEGVFGDEEAMVRLDMSEYMEKHSVSKLVGPPPGYVGFGEGGTLTEAVRRRPFTVVLFDEIEKAHPDVSNIMLQVFEDGRLTDSQGRVVSFKNTVLVLTSNIGSGSITGGMKPMGFAPQAKSEEEAEEQAYTRIRAGVLDELRGFFRPELLNRLDEVVVFRQLPGSAIRKIADLLLRDTAKRLEEHGVSLELTAGFMERLVEEGSDIQWGARPLRRAVSAMVDDPLSDAYLKGRLEPGNVARMVLGEGGEAEVEVLRAPAGEEEEHEIVYSHIIDMDAGEVVVTDADETVMT